MSENINVTQMWISPEEYAHIVSAETSVPMCETFPDGIFVRMLTATRTPLQTQNATREQAQTLMAEWSHYKLKDSEE